MGRLIDYSWAIVAFYYQSGDRLNFAKNLQILANGYRTIGQEAKAKQFTGHAWNILRQRYANSTDLDVLMIVHKAAMWDLRLWADYLEPWVIDYRIKQMIGFAEKVNNPAIWIETYRELAGYYGRTRHDEDKAHTTLQEIDRIRNTVSSLPPYGATTFLRPKIEAMLHSGYSSNKEEGIHTITTDFVTAYKNERQLHFWSTLKQWSKKYGLGLQLEPPKFSSIMLVHMPRGVPKQ
jgi:hypothetical protein